MKRLRIIGGIAPGSTVDYYRLLITAYREQKRDGSSWPCGAASRRDRDTREPGGNGNAEVILMMTTKDPSGDGRTGLRGR